MDVEDPGIVFAQLLLHTFTERFDLLSSRIGCLAELFLLSIRIVRVLFNDVVEILVDLHKDRGPHCDAWSCGGAVENQGGPFRFVFGYGGRSTRRQFAKKPRVDDDPCHLAGNGVEKLQFLGAVVSVVPVLDDQNAYGAFAADKRDTEERFELFFLGYGEISETGMFVGILYDQGGL